MLYKIDGRAGDIGRIVWRMDPGQEKMPDANRGAALWGKFSHHDGELSASRSGH